MAENTLFEAAQQLNQSLYETNQAIAQSAVTAQERNVAFVQAAFERGIEVLKGHVAATQSLLETVAAQSQNPQEVVQATIESTVAAQKRNVALVQNILEEGVKAAKSHGTATQELAQALTAKVQEQQEAFVALPYMKAYTDLFHAQLSYQKRAMETSQALTDQALALVQQSLLQGMEVGQKVTQQALDTILAATPEK